MGPAHSRVLFIAPRVTPCGISRCNTIHIKGVAEPSVFWLALWQSYAYVIDNPATVCTVNNGVAVLNLPPPSANYVCDGDKMESGSMWLGIAGLMIIGILMSRSFKGSIIIGAPPPAPRHTEA